MNDLSLCGSLLPQTMRELIDGLDRGSLSRTVPSAEHAAVVAAMLASSTGRSVFIVAPTSTTVERVSGIVRYLLEYGPVPCDFPRWPAGEPAPYDPVIESPFISATRLGALATLSLAENTFVMTMEADKAATRVIPFENFCEGIARLQVDREIDLDEMASLLVASGYRRTSTVAEVGEFAVRNAVLDVYSPFHDDPFRLEVDYGLVEAVRFFDPATQRTRRNADHVWIVPVWDVPSGQSAMKTAGIRLRDAAAAQGIPSSDILGIENQVSEGRTPPGFQGMLPYFHENLDLPFDYAGDEVTVIVIDPDGCRASADASLDRLQDQYGELCGTRKAEPGQGRVRHRAAEGRQLAAEPSRLVVGGSALIDRLAARPRTVFLGLDPSGGLLGPSHRESFSRELVLATTQEVPVADRVAAVVTLARRTQENGDGLLLVAPSEGESRRVREILTAEGLNSTEAPGDGLASLLLARGTIRTGVGRVKVPFGIEMYGVFVIPTESVFGVKDVSAGRQREKKNLRKIQEFRELSPGDLVIHRDHGMGVFERMTEVSVDGIVSECLLLTYKDGDRLYVPVDRANLLDKYTPPAEGEARPLDRLGSQSWVKRRASARGAARDIARQLKALYARRMAATAPSMTPPDNDFREFEASFPWETTPDQEKAIEEILDDLQKTTPIDRLICGDVGFGKTEVAVRAAYKAVSDGYQVAVLVPTTILAEQHRLTFAARYRNTPVVVESISRFKSPRENKESLQRLRTGAIDVIVGTHRLLSADVKFQNLGLLIIDEEHRFGVAHKERLREMSVGVHTISLTATPIPRTLHMALSGIRELSLITTPPRDRLAVRTFVARTGVEIIRSAILRETARGGQVFVVHNRVEDIFDFANRISAAVPEAKLCVAHGQMSAGELETVMSAFIRGEKDVLVATTIIESGLDIGTANTMLIHDADRLGLAQLYQLRGRVGRSSEQAYCYLLVRDPSVLSGEARMRIEAIERFSELASGFNLASMDLAIRGGGDILGAEQSGHMAAVGEEMFMDMLHDAVMELSGEEVRERPDPDIKVDVEVRIPREYLPDERLRLRFYKRISGAMEAADIDFITSELVDRFGPLPEAAANLVAMMRLKVAAAAAGLAGVAIRDGQFMVSSFPDTTATLAPLADRFIAAGFEVLPGGCAERMKARPVAGIEALSGARAMAFATGLMVPFD